LLLTFIYILVDVWSAGVIFAELMSNKIFFKGENFKDMLIKIFDVIGTPIE
jgi:hypothetical protein